MEASQKALESSGRINLEHALCTVLEEATQRAELLGVRVDEDPVVLALRTALCAHVREKRLAQVDEARGVLEDAINESAREVAKRCCAAELRVHQLEEQLKGVL